MGAVMAVGLHRLLDSGQVTAASEIRKRVYAAVYYTDKCSSSFNGRPPLLSRHYCNLILPLDLGDEELFGGSEMLASAVAKLDENGWNRDGKMHPVTARRALWFMTTIREETLEISLGTNVKVSASKIESVNLTRP